MGAPRPATVRGVRAWLEHYRDWQAELSAGSAGRGPDVGGGAPGRIGRPTEAAATRRVDLQAQVAVVAGWLAGLTDAERMAAERYLSGGEITASDLAAEFGLTYHNAAALVRLVPWLIFWRWYGRTSRDGDGRAG